jgi:hypothetical protein
MAKKPRLFTMLDKSSAQKSLSDKVSLREIHERFTKEYKFSPRSFRTFLMKYPQIFNYTTEQVNELLWFPQGILELSPVFNIYDLKPLYIFLLQGPNEKDSCYKPNDF